MKNIWIYTLCIIALFACTKNDSFDSYKGEGYEHKLHISASLTSFKENTQSKLSSDSIFKQDSDKEFADNSRIGICTYRSGRFDAIKINAYKSDLKAENILSVKKNNQWTNQSDIYLREPANVYAYYPYTDVNFIPGNTNNPAITSDDESPSLYIFPGQTDYLYGKAEKKGSCLLDIITPLCNNANIKFRHAMALITILIKNQSGTEQQLSRITLNNITAKAKLNISNGAITATEDQPVTINFPEYQSGKYNNLTTTTINSLGTGKSDKMALLRFHTFAIPMVLTGSNTVSLTLNGSIKECSLNTEDSGIWESGKAYFYTIRIDKNDIISVESIQQSRL
ncbi:MAG: fimbrillin family protein [Bacteroidales bacterium]